MGRFTRSQSLLGNSIRSLIKLYYLEELRKLTEEGSWDIVSDEIGSFLGLFFDKGCYSRQTEKFCVSPGHPIRIDHDQLNSFMEIMDSLSESTIKHELVHFHIKAIQDETHTTVSREGVLSDGHDAKTLRYQNLMKDGIPAAKINKAVRTSLRKQQRHTETISDCIAISSTNLRFVFVNPISDVAKKLLLAEPREEQISAIPSLSFPAWTSFIQLVRAIFVNYHLAFGSFERIKACGLCQRLFFEKKKDSGTFCSYKCRKRHCEEQEPRAKRLCRERQKAWMRYQLKDFSNLHPDPVFKSDCASCDDFVASGSCPILLRKNRNELEQISRLKAEQRGSVTNNGRS